MANCIVCNNDKTSHSYYPKLAFNNKIFEYRKCKNCGLVFLVPSLTDEDTEKLYSTDYHNEFYFKSNPVHKDYEVKLLRRYKQGERLLDYGCGDASFLKLLNNKGYQLSGVEYNHGLVHQLKTNIPYVHFFSVDSFIESGNISFDVIHLGDVLAHLINPAETIKLLHSRLSPKGILFVESPLEHNFHLAYLFKAGVFKIKKWLKPHRVVNAKPYRLFFSDRKNQKLFFEQLGFKTLHFEIIEWAWPFPDNWKDAKTLKQKTEFLIAEVSKFFSKRIKNWGNRYFYIGTPNGNQYKNISS
jgi:2-polyprenyl-3-methyl-5-hydroxy-6-metoxy-1,4-benzoquinol methylase